MKTGIVFYKGKGNFVDRLIRWWTNSPYSHSEVVIGDKWYTSHQFHGGTLVRENMLDPSAYSSSWEFVEIPFGAEDAVEKFNSIHPAKYDWLGIALSQVLPVSVHHEQRWFCSELCHWMIIGSGKSNRYSPGDLYNLVTKLPR